MVLHSDFQRAFTSTVNYETIEAKNELHAADVTAPRRKNYINRVQIGESWLTHDDLMCHCYVIGVLQYCWRLWNISQNSGVFTHSLHTIIFVQTKVHSLNVPQNKN